MLWSRSTDRRYAPPTIQQLTGGHRGRAEIRSTEYDTPRARATHRSTHGKMCWGFSQRLIAAYAHPDRRRGKTMMTEIIHALRSGVPHALEELAQLGRTLWRRRADVLVYFDHHTSNGPTEAINGRLEALHRNALGLPELRALMRGDSRLSPHSRFHTEHPASDPPHRLNGRRTHHANRQRD